MSLGCLTLCNSFFIALQLRFRVRCVTFEQYFCDSKLNFHSSPTTIRSCFMVGFDFGAEMSILDCSRNNRGFLLSPSGLDLVALQLYYDTSFDIIMFRLISCLTCRQLHVVVKVLVKQSVSFKTRNKLVPDHLRVSLRPSRCSWVLFWRPMRS